MERSPLTPSNYYQNQDYMDASSFKPFLECEAAALAEYKGEYKPKFQKKGPDPLVFGNFIHSYFQSEKAHEDYLISDKDVKEEVFKYGNPSKGLKKDYADGGLADTMIKSLEEEPLFMNLYGPGDKEVIVTGQLGDYSWKGKIDSLNLERGYFCDLKTVDNFHRKHWSDSLNRYVNFAVDRGYFFQIALYQELIYQVFDKWCVPFICAVSKQDPPDKSIYKFSSDEAKELLDDSLDTIKAKQDHVFSVIAGEVPPQRCERCKWCRQTKKLTGATDIMDIELD